jgi:hypothetical protein
LPDLEGEVEAEALLNLDLNVVDGGSLEGWLFDSNGVEAGRYGREGIVSRIRGNCPPNGIRRHVGEGYFRGRYGGPARIADVARDLAERLSV